MLLRRTLLGTAIATTLAASSVFAETTIGGYGELHYNNLTQTEIDGGEKDKKEFDFHRFVLMFGHDFNDNVRFFSEVEIEHAFLKDTDTQTGTVSKAPGELELEQAYIEIDLNDTSSISAGVFLIPVGILNETHEPPTFYGVERGPLEKDVIPATWWEAGVKYSGHTDFGLSYDLALHSGLKAPTGKIRDGRQKVASAVGEDLATTVRVKYTGLAGLNVAMTAQKQNNLQQTVTDTDTPVAAPVAGADATSATMWEAHAIYTLGPVKLTAQRAAWDIDMTPTYTNSSNPASKQAGTMVEASYKISDKLGVAVRQTEWSTTVGVENSQTTLALNYWPHEDVVLKIDYQNEEQEGHDDPEGEYKTIKGFNLGVGYQF
jgi:predicted porin